MIGPSIGPVIPWLSFFFSVSVSIFSAFDIVPPKPEVFILWPVTLFKKESQSGAKLSFATKIQEQRPEKVQSEWFPKPVHRTGRSRSLAGRYMDRRFCENFFYFFDAWRNYVFSDSRALFSVSCFRPVGPHPVTHPGINGIKRGQATFIVCYHVHVCIKPCDAIIPRAQQAGFVYHVINRGNGRATIFHKDQDYQAFLSILALAKARHPVKMFAFALMPNHFHFLIEASHHQPLSRFHAMAPDQSRTALSQALRQQRACLAGPVKSFPVQRGEHLIMVLRYVLQNPARSGLAASIDDWPWSTCCRNELADPCPVEVQTDWLAHVDEPLSASQLASIRQSVNRQRPFGEPGWQTTIAGLCGLESTMRPRGRPALREMRK
jgi:putative transposase